MSITNNIERLFYPNIYDKKLKVNNELDLCLLRKKGLAKYVLVVVQFEAGLTIPEQIKRVRRNIRQHTKALWLLNEVGAYIVFKGATEVVNKDQLVIDKFGFHAVIIQGIHVIADSGEHVFNHSKWLNHTFGDSDGISELLQNI